MSTARMLNFSSNNCCHHIEDDGSRQFIEKCLRIDLETAGKIEDKTLGQSTNDSWFMERKNRLTASSSSVGSVIHRREHIDPKSILKRIFSKEKFKNVACDWGIQNEKNALEEHAIK